MTGLISTDNGRSKLQILHDIKFDITEVPLAAFSIFNESTAILANGNTKSPIQLGDSGFADSLALVGWTKSTYQNMADDLGPKKTLGLLKEQYKAKSKIVQTIFLMKDNGKVTRIASARDKGLYVTPSKLASLVEVFTLRDEMPLVINDVYVQPSIGKASINVVVNSPVTLPMPGEDICTGLNLELDIFEGITVREFILRLVCSNGMVGERLRDVGTKLNSASSAEQWYDVLFNPGRFAKLVGRYTAAVEIASKVQLSVAEYEFIYSHCINNYTSTTDFHQIHQVFNDDSWKMEYQARGMNITQNESSGGESNERRKNMPTPYNAWAAVNLMTWLASNGGSQTGQWVKYKTLFQAGSILYTKWDGQGFVYDVPKFEMRFHEIVSVQPLDSDCEEEE